MSDVQKRTVGVPMERAPVVNDLLDSVGELRRLASELEGREGEELVTMKALAIGVANALTALSMSLGECRKDVPYSPMRPVRTATGQLIWCCNHDPEHC